MGPRPNRGLACPTVSKLLREARLVVASGRMGDVKGKPSIQGLSIRTTYTLFRYRRLRQSTSKGLTIHRNTANSDENTPTCWV